MSANDPKADIDAAQIRVTAQLIDTRTGGHVWSNRYDRPATDLFNVQSDVTGKIVATLAGYEGAVAEAERSLIRRKPPSDLTPVLWGTVKQGV